MNGELEIRTTPRKKKKKKLTTIWVVSIIISFCFGMLGSYFIIKNFLCLNRVMEIIY